MEWQREGAGRAAEEDFALKASPGEEGRFHLRVCTFSQQLVYLFNPPPAHPHPLPPSLPSRPCSSEAGQGDASDWDEEPLKRRLD